MKKLFTILSSILCLMTISNVNAQSYYEGCVGQCVDPCVGQCCETSGNFYIGGFGGANWMNRDRFHGEKLKTKVGFTGGLSLGYAFDNGFRMEGEVSYRRNRLKNNHYDDNSYYSYSGKSGSHGSLHSWSYMANFLYDFHDVSCYCPNFVPYLGVGVGYSQNHSNLKRNYCDSYDCYSNSRSDHHKKSSGGFAYQGIAGLGYRLTDSTTLAAEYRYFAGKNHVRDQGVCLAIRQAF